VLLVVILFNQFCVILEITYQISEIQQRMLWWEQKTSLYCHSSKVDPLQSLVAENIQRTAIIHVFGNKTLNQIRKYICSNQKLLQISSSSFYLYSCV